LQQEFENIFSMAVFNVLELVQLV